MTEVRPADPAARQRLLVALFIVVALGGLLVFFLPSVQQAAMTWLNAEGGDPLARAIGLLRGLGVMLGLTLLAPAIYCWVIALRIDTSGEFPPPDMKVVREVRVLRGDAARGRAWLLRAIAIKFALLALAASILVWVLAATLLR